MITRPYGSFRGIAILALSGLLLRAHAQEDFRGQRIYPEKLHQDLALLVEVLQQEHPDPYRYHDALALERIAAQVKDSIRVPMDASEFMIQLLPVFQAIGDANCQPEVPAAYKTQLQQRVPLLPLKVKLLDEGVFVEQELKGFRSIPSGSRIHSINGRDMDRIIEKLCAAMIADGSNRTWKLRRIEQELHLLHASHIERTPEFAISFTPPGGTPVTTTIHAMTGDEIDRSRKPEGIDTHPWSATLDQESRTMWCTLKSMDEQDLIRSGQRPDRFLEAMLDEMRENDVRTLVMDLRGAAGEDLELAHRVFASIAREPFRLISASTLSGNDTQDARIDLLPTPIPVAGGLSDSRHREKTGRIPTLHRPDPKAFRGKVYVICDGSTRNAAAALVMAAKRTGTALVLGEETGTNSVSFTGGGHMDMQLPESGVQVRIPLHLFIPEGNAKGPADHGEFPDHIVATTPHALSKGVDGVKRSMSRLINELQ